MKKIIWIVVLAGILALLMTLSIEVTKTTVEVVHAQTPEDNLTHQQQAWLGALEWCESRGDPTRINPKDKDNTPSYGLLQFKPGTFATFRKQYGVTGKLMDPDAQEAIVEAMIQSKGINWHQQFPDCVKKLGLPPKLST